jgi:hypothetical protein
MHMAGGDAQGGEGGGMYVHHVHPPWVRPWLSLFFHSATGYLKVVGNEKLGGLRFLQLLGIVLGPW